MREDRHTNGIIFGSFLGCTFAYHYIYLRKEGVGVYAFSYKGGDVANEPGVILHAGNRRPSGGTYVTLNRCTVRLGGVSDA